MGGLSYVQADMGFKGFLVKLIKGFILQLVRGFQALSWCYIVYRQFVMKQTLYKRQLDNVASKYTQLHYLGV